MTDFLRGHKMIAAGLAALIQCGLLVYMIQSRAAILRNGSEVVLKTEPVDPRDLLRGDYVVLSYAISSIPASEIEGDINVAQPQSAPVYVALRREAGGVWEKSRASAAPIPDLLLEEVMIKGRARDSFTPKSSDIVRIDYGIERFYVPEGEGRAIEAERNERRIDVVVMIGAGGAAQIKRLMDGETALYDEPLY